MPNPDEWAAEEALENVRRLSFKPDKVDRVATYFAEDKDEAALADDWGQLDLSDVGSREALMHVVDTGLKCGRDQRMTLLADMLDKLVKKGFYTKDAVHEMVATFDLDDVRIDNPLCDTFIEYLNERFPQ